MSVDKKWIVFFGEDWGRHHSTGQYLAKELAKNHRVLWINSLGMRAPKLNVRDISRIFYKLFDFVGSLFKKRVKVHNQEPDEQGIEVLAPLAIPLLNFRIVRLFNRAFVLRLIKGAMSRLHISQPIVITSCPAAVDLIDQLEGSVKVYYCADEHSEIHGMDRELVRSLEKELLEKVDVVVASAKMLVTMKSKQHGNVHYLPHGVDYQLFREAVNNKHSAPKDIAGIKTPIIGFVGLIGEHIDMSIISYLSGAFKDSFIVMVGPVEEGYEVVKAPNIIYTGEKKRAELPNYLAHFKACILPYKQTERNKFANPTKINEYLAAGCPVITVPHPEVNADTMGIYVAGDVESFAGGIRAAFQTSVDEKKMISNGMETSTWQHRTQHFLEIIDTRSTPS